MERINKKLSPEKEQRKLTRRLSQLFGRKTLAGFKDKAEERKFFREAEEEEERVIEEERERQREREKREFEERRAVEEKRKLERDLVKEMDLYRQRRLGIGKSDGEFKRVLDGREQRERVQELSEKAFNEALTPLEEIRAWAESGDERALRREVETETGEKVEVIDLKGLPIRFLAHAIDFKGNGEEKRTGGEMAGRIQKDPSLWARKREEIKPNSQDGDSDCISMSYIDSDVNMFRMGSGGKYFNLKYGFDHVLPDSILQVKVFDGATARDIGGARTFLGSSDVYMPEELAERTQFYNEVQVRRFDDDGKPRKPDFMVVYDGRGMETMARHAAFFKVPILNIETREYTRTEVERFLEGIDEVFEQEEKGEPVSYEEVRKIYERIQASGVVRGEKKTERLGAAPEIHTQTILGAEADGKINRFLEYERERRTEEVRRKFAEGARALREGAERGERAFRIKTDIVKVERHTPGVDGYPEREPEKIDVQFRLRDGKVYETVFFKGEGRGYETFGGQKIEGTNEFFDAVLPEAEEYLDALIEADKDRDLYSTQLEMKRRKASTGEA